MEPLYYYCEFTTHYFNDLGVDIFHADFMIDDFGNSFPVEYHSLYGLDF